MRPTMAVVLVVTLLAAGCGGDDDGDDVSASDTSSTSTTSTTTSTTTTTTSEGATTTSSASPTPGFDGATTRTSAPAPSTNTGVALLTDVRLAGQDGFDRVVFEFRDQLPGYDVAYADGPVRQDGSGEVVDVEGDAVLVVRLTPASGVDLSGPNFNQTYTGPDRLRGDTDVVAEVVRLGDFEANLTWAIGLGGKVPFRVEVLTGPPRVVVDLSAS